MVPLNGIQCYTLAADAGAPRRRWRVTLLGVLMYSLDGTLALEQIPVSRPV
ncbi:hypothetical protein [Congregibacter sp.]|uniref:hypothetical protein n=1 Tax=Congregibacter sp. TaxID=2744308 RepID=UPI003F6AC750